MTVQNKGHVIMSTDEVVEVSIVSSLFHSGYATSTVPKGHAALVEIAPLQIQLISFILYGQVYDLDGYEMVIRWPS